MIDVEKQIRWLESQDLKVADDARQSLVYLVSGGLNITDLVSYYVNHRSERVLEILCKVKEPFDKVLLDSLISAIQSKKSQETLILLGQVVQQSPTWVPKIATHPIFNQLLDMIRKSGQQIADCIAGLLFMALLIPHCPNIHPSSLNSMFVTFAACSELYRQGLRDLEKKKFPKHHEHIVNIFHLGYAIREYFHVLYGIYPNSLLSYLKSIHGEKTKMIQSVVVPLCNGVRLHPNMILYGKDKELNKERFAHREAHDFLDDIRRIIIGMIPLPVVGESNCSEDEPDSPGVIPSNFFSTLFPTEHSSSSSTAWNEIWGDEDHFSFMESINTPPGSQISTPSMKRGNIDDGDEPIVIATEDKGKRRRSTGPEKFRLSFNLFGRSRPVESRRTNAPSYIEETKAEEDPNRFPDNETAEMAEDALAPDQITTPIPHSSQSIPRSLYAGNDSSSPPSVPTVINMITGQEDKARSRTPSVIPPESNHVSPYNSEVAFRQQNLKLLEDRTAAVKAVKAGRDRPFTVEPDENAVVRSRSTSFLFGPPNEEKERTSTVDTGTADMMSDNGDNPNDSMDGVRNRFSVTSYFSKINRQRFVSECPTIEPDTLNEWTNSKHHTCCKIMERTNSCPNISGELFAKVPAVEVRAEIESKNVVKPVSVFDQFPYLKLIQPVENKFYDQLERKLEDDHEVRREAYMEASRDFHNCLKELGLADRLPGKIYDDMTHITEGLPDPVKQRDILRTRLQLVNQHLMYERSCRLLHANRNRKLFAKIKQQKVNETEYMSSKQNAIQLNKEKNNLTQALTDMRKKLEAKTREHDAREYNVNQEMDKMKKEMEIMRAQFVEMEERAVLAEKNAKLWSSQIDRLKRRADDADELLVFRNSQVEELKREVTKLKDAVARNQQMRDQLVAMNEFRREDERMRTPEVDERIVKQYITELEKLRVERDKDRIHFDLERAKWSETETLLRQERNRINELQRLVNRTEKLLMEHNEAAEQKFLALQTVVHKQEEFIAHLHHLLEVEQNGIRDEFGHRVLSISRQDHALEIRTIGTPIEPSPPFYWAPVETREHSPRDIREQTDSPAFDSPKEHLQGDD